MADSNLNSVHDRLKQFTRRYYFNQLLQGFSVFLAASLILLAGLSVFEFTQKTSSEARGTLLIITVILEIAGFIYLVLMPALRMSGRLNALSEEEISKIIGQREEKVRDQLLNMLMLEKMNSNQPNSVLSAAIQQKAIGIAKVPFHLKASIKKGINFLKYSAVVLVLAVLSGMSFPEVVDYGTRRIIFFNENIIPPPPYTFNLKSPLKAVKDEAYTVDIEVNGDFLPEEVFLLTDNGKIKTSKSGYNTFEYRFPQVTEQLSFQIISEDVISSAYTVDVSRRPSIVMMEIQADFPSYTGVEDKSIVNQGNISVPEGTNISWLVKTESSGAVNFHFENGSENLLVDNGEVKKDTTLRSTLRYSIGAAGDDGLKSDSMNFQIEVIRDQFPSIEVVNEADSTGQFGMHFGRLSDDYGISQLYFVHKIDDGQWEKELLKVEKDVLQDFIYRINWESWDIKDGQEVSYFFEVWDNDAVNGSKSSRSKSMTFSKMSPEAIENEKNKMSDELREELKEALKESKDLNKDIEDLQLDLIDKKKIDWNAQKKMEQIVKRSENLQKKMNDIQKKNEQKNQLEDRLTQSDDLVQKREELEDLMRKVLDDEMLEKMKELQELMEKLNKEEATEMLEDMEISNEQLEMELDRSLELFKQLEFEMKLDDVMSELDEMIQKQDDIQQETEEGGSKEEQESNKENQEELKEEFEKWEEELERLKEMNEDLERKHGLEEMKKERKETREAMEKAKENMEKNQQKKAGEQQQKSKENMQEMQNSLNGLKSAMMKKSQEDVQSLRNTLENLVELSFKQEEIMGEMKGMRGDDPRFNELTREQRNVLDGMKLAEDSLVALSKRISQIEPMINRELYTSKRYMEKSLKSMTERKLGEVSRNQQMSMTAMNNLALLLSEVIDQLQEQMAQSMGQCSKPGDSKPKNSSMKQLQEQLNQQLSDMKKNMEQKGKSKGKGQGKDKQEAESLAKMAAQQAKIREELRKMQENANQKEGKGLQKIGEMMEETERDIVNRQITKETIERQEKILTKLLEAEQAEREQDMDEKRESFGAKEEKKGNLLDLDEYYKARNENHDALMKQNISLNRYYREKVEEYFKTTEP